jgi:hypothetical protein
MLVAAAMLRTWLLMTLLLQAMLLLLLLVRVMGTLLV